MIRVKQKGRDEFEESFWFRGIPKFTGLTAQDEDEVSNSHQHSFFYRGKTMSDARGFYETLKSNGENAKLSLRVLNGVVYLISGSKGTCMIWPADSAASKFYDVETPLSFADALKSDKLEAADVSDFKFSSGVRSGFSFVVSFAHRYSNKLFLGYAIDRHVRHRPTQTLTRKHRYTSRMHTRIGIFTR